MTKFTTETPCTLVVISKSGERIKFIKCEHFADASIKAFNFLKKGAWSVEIISAAQD